MPRARSSSPRRPLSIPVLLAVVLAALVVPLAGRATDLRLASAWRGEPIRIDGNDEEWRGRTAPVEGKRFALGLQNDADAIYLCLTTNDRVLATQIARQGLMVWFDPGPERPKKHVFGLHFPIDSRLAAMRDPADRWPRDGGDVSEASQAAVGILRPGKDDPLRVPLDEAGGIVARAAFHGALLVYEVKVPLKGTGAGPYAVAANPGGVPPGTRDARVARPAAALPQPDRHRRGGVGAGRQGRGRLPVGGRHLPEADRPQGDRPARVGPVRQGGRDSCCVLTRFGI
jgi:hypothetical protein